MTTEENTKMNTEEKDNKEEKEVKAEAATEVIETEPPAETEKKKKTSTKKAAAGTKKKSTAAKKDKEVKEAVKGEESTEVVKEEKKDDAPDNPLSITFSVEVKKEEIAKDFDEALIKYANEIKLPGFRKGKIPVEVIRSRFKDAITGEVVDKIVETAVFQKIEKDKMKIITRPEILKVDYEDGKDLTADVQVEVFPTVVLPDFSSLEFEVPKDELKIDPFDEAKQIDAILEGNRRQVPVVSREIQDQDYAMYKLQSKILKTKKMTPKKSDHFMVDKNTPSEILDLYKEFVGKKIDDSFSFIRTYPEDYKKKVWAGKEIEHYITIESIFEMVKPDLDENFLKGVGFEKVEDFKKKLKEEYDNFNEKNSEDKRMKFLLDKVSDTIQFPIPKAMVGQELSRMIQQMQEQPPQIDVNDKDQLKAHMDNMQVDAERNIRFSFIMEAIKEEHKLEVTSDDMEKEYKVLAEQNSVPVKDVRKFYMQKENGQNLREALIRNKVTDFLKEQVTIKEV
jgi:trigger factor